MDWLDKTGIAASSTCALHCGLTGLLVALQPLTSWAGEWLPHIEQFDIWFLLVSMLCAGIALGHGAWQHRHRGPILLALTGFALWATTFLLLEHRSFQGAFLSVVAGLCLVGAHAWNLRCSHCHKRRHP